MRFLGDTLDPTAQPTQTVGFTSIIDNILKTAQAYLTFDQAKDLARINTQRAAQGLPPLDASQYATGVNVGISSGTKETILWVAGGLAAAFVIGSLVKGRR